MAKGRMEGCFDNGPEVYNLVREGILMLTMLPYEIFYAFKWRCRDELSLLFVEELDQNGQEGAE
jgi:hypothetical protein